MAERLQSLLFPPVVLVLSLPGFSPAFPGQDPAALQQQAIQRIDRVNEYRRKTGDLSGLLSERQQAFSELTTSYQGFVAHQDLASAGLCLIKLGDIQRMQGQWQQAKDLCQQAYELARKAGHAGYQVKALLGFAKTEIYRPPPNDYQAAIKLLDLAIRLGGDKKDLGDALELKAEALTELREYNAALEVINRAATLAGDINDQLMLFYAFFDRGQIYVKLASACDTQSVPGFKLCYEALDRAQSDLEKAAGIARSLGYDGLANPISLALRSVALRRSLVKNQEGFYSRIYGEKYKLFHPTRPQDVGVSTTFISRDQSPDDQNVAMLKRILPEYIKRLEKEGDTARSYSARGSLQEILGQNDVALQSHLKAVELLEADRGRLRDERSRGTYLEDKMQVFYNAILSLLDRNRNDEAFDLLERSRSRAMADLLQSHELSFTRPEDRRLYAESVQTRARISQLQSQLARYRMEASNSQNTGRIAAAEKEILRMESDYLKLQQGAGAKLQELIVSKPVSLQSLQRSMREDSFEVLYYLVLPTQIVLWHIGGDTSNVCSVFIPREELIKKVVSLRKSLVDGTSTFDQQTARELYLYLVQPALKWIKTDHLVIIPHDDLNYLPFQVLKDWGSEQYFGERFQISYAPSATILLGQKKAGNIRAGNLLAVADPQLEDARDEVQAIGQLYSGRSKVVFDIPARESEVKTWVGGYDLIHLSVHGKFRADEPLLSHLVFDKGGPDDGMLTAAEMFGLRLEKARLVVLSACETGQVAATNANEIIGMERALLFAGANSLILSSWAVDAASTRLWMETFYREAQSKTLCEAARSALVAVKKRPEYNHPYHWAAFLLIGR